MFDWNSHYQKVSESTTFTYGELHSLESVLGEKIHLLEPHWKNSKDPVDRRDFKNLSDLRRKICGLMFQIDQKDPVKRLY